MILYFMFYALGLACGVGIIALVDEGGCYVCEKPKKKEEI